MYVILDELDHFEVKQAKVIQIFMSILKMIESNLDLDPE
jgi:hypothetical protein